MQGLSRIVSAGLIVIGLVWIGQGVGLIPGSFMTGDPFWAVSGIAVAGAGVAIGLLSRRTQH